MAIGTVAGVLVDTDVFVAHLRSVERLRRESDRLHYSVLTRCELFAGRGTNEGRVRLLLDAFEELPVDRAIAERAGRVRRQFGLTIPDALIAATALEHDLRLDTRNRKDFQSVKGLKLR